MHAILTLAAKDLRLLIRDRVGFFFTFFFPLVYAIFFGVLFGNMSSGPDAVRVVMVDEDRTPQSARLLERIQRGGTLQMDAAATVSEAEDLVRRGRRAAAIIVPPGFGAAAQRIFWGEPMTVRLRTDPGQGMTAGLIEGLVTAAAYEQMQAVFTQPDMMMTNARGAREMLNDEPNVPEAARTALFNLLGNVETLGTVLSPGASSAPADSTASAGTAPAATESGALGGWRPVRVETSAVRASSRAGQPRVSAFAICFPQGIIWGVMACAATFAASLLVERTRGTLPRLTTAPVGAWQILLGKAGACFAATVALVVVLLLIARVVFGVVPQAPALLVLAVPCVAVGMVGLMMVFSVLGRTEQAVNGVSWAVIIVMAMLGGGMVPLMFMPAWMQSLANVSLVKWSIVALEGAIWRGFSLAEMLPPCLVLLAVGLVGFGVGASLFRVHEDR